MVHIILNIEVIDGVERDNVFFGCYLLQAGHALCVLRCFLY